MSEIDLIIIVAAICFIAVVICLTLRWGQEPWWRRWRKNPNPPQVLEHLDGYNRVTSRELFYQLPAPIVVVEEIEVSKDA